MDTLFDLSGKVAVITGGGGLLGRNHARAIARQGGTPILLDVNLDAAGRHAQEVLDEFGVRSYALACDITDPQAVSSVAGEVLARHGCIDILVNNAANNPKVEDPSTNAWGHVENFPLEQWNADIAVGLTGTFLCCKVIGADMARRGTGSIVNIASYLGILAPEPRLYHKEGLADAEQPVKPISYTAVKSAIYGLTRYLAAYWGDKNVRVNALTPGGVFNGQDAEFVRKLSARIPLGRMAEPGEMEGALVFLASAASSYVTGANVIVDGGRVCW